MSTAGLGYWEDCADGLSRRLGRWAGQVGLGWVAFRNRMPLPSTLHPTYTLAREVRNLFQMLPRPSPCQQFSAMPEVRDLPARSLLPLARTHVIITSTRTHDHYFHMHACTQAPTSRARCAAVVDVIAVRRAADARADGAGGAAHVDQAPGGLDWRGGAGERESEEKKHSKNLEFNGEF